MRITGGALRSRVLVAPRGDATRPTTDRVREALFSMLASRGRMTHGVRVLDLYAGTGALSFEALSRGAAEAVIVENDRAALASIRENAKTLGVEARAVVVPLTVDKALVRLVGSDGPFDLVFLDPPYALVKTPAFAEELARVASLLAPDGLLVLEHGKRDTPPLVAALGWDEPRAYGDTHISFARRGSA